MGSDPLKEDARAAASEDPRMRSHLRAAALFNRDVRAVPANCAVMLDDLRPDGGSARLGRHILLASFPKNRDYGTLGCGRTVPSEDEQRRRAMPRQIAARG